MKTTKLRKALYALSALALAALLLWSAWALLRGTTPIVRIRAAAVFGSVVLLGATFESIRRTQLKEGYALLWIIPSFVILLLACFPVVLQKVYRYFGMTYASTMAAVAFAALMVAVFVICRTLSKNERNIARIAQRLALLEERLREAEKAAVRREPPRG
jgi:hypothetical protein